MPRTSRRSEPGPGSSSTRSGARIRSSSPLSPVRDTTLEQKNAMVQLNDRLASYIEHIRGLKIENEGLKRQVRSVEESIETQVTTVRNKYVDEVDHLRSALDDASRMRAKAEMEADKSDKENRELRSKLKDKSKRLDAAENELKMLKSKNLGLSDDLKAAENSAASLGSELKRVETELSNVKSELEEETLKRIEAQNKLTTSMESQKFEHSLLEQQLNESKVKRKIEISELDGKLNEKYEEKLQAQMSEMRAEYEKQMAANREELLSLSEAKLQGLQDKLEQERSMSARRYEESRESESRISTLETNNNDLESNIEALKKELDAKKRRWDEDEKRYRANMAAKDAELRSKQEQLDDTTKDLKETMALKASMDMEVAAYRKLLEGEEQRLGLSQSESPQSGNRGVKRRRTTYLQHVETERVSSHTGKGNIVIEAESVQNGSKFIKLTNVGEKAITLTGYTLVNVSGDTETSYKFHRGFIVQPKATSTIWSSDAEHEHSPPTNAVMREGAWQIGEENETTLSNKNGDIEAKLLTRNQDVVVNDDVFEGNGRDDNRSCVVM